MAKLNDKPKYPMPMRKCIRCGKERVALPKGMPCGPCNEEVKRGRKPN